MSLKMKVWTLLDIALRVPPIFVMDKALKYEFKPREEDIIPQINADVLNYKNHSEEYFVHPWISKCVIEDYGFAFLELLLYIQGKFMQLKIIHNFSYIINTQHFPWKFFAKRYKF